MDMLCKSHSSGVSPAVLRSAAELFVAEAALAVEKILLSLVLAMGSLSTQTGSLIERPEAIYRILQKSKHESVPQNKDDGDSEEGEDDDEEDDGDDDQDGDDQEEYGREGEEENDKEDDENDGPEANGEGGSDEDGDEGDEDDDDDDESDEEDEEEDEEAELLQPPTKKRK